MIQGNGCLNLGFLGYLGAATLLWRAFSETSDTSQWKRGMGLGEGNDLDFWKMFLLPGFLDMCLEIFLEI